MALVLSFLCDVQTSSSRHNPGFRTAVIEDGVVREPLPYRPCRITLAVGETLIGHSCPSGLEKSKLPTYGHLHPILVSHLPIAHIIHESATTLWPLTGKGNNMKYLVTMAPESRWNILGSEHVVPEFDLLKAEKWSGLRI